MALRPGGHTGRSERSTVAALGSGISESRFAGELFLLTAAMFAGAIGLGVLLARLVPPPHSTNGTFVVPFAFAFSTTLLVLCSTALEHARSAVRRERQRRFRRSLVTAVVLATAFVGVQGFALWGIVQNLHADRNAGEAQLGATMLVLGSAVLHGLHVTVAMMVLSYVTLRALNDRYDHEYSFGVSVCTWFWHILGVVWIFILGAYAVVTSFLTIRVPA